MSWKRKTFKTIRIVLKSLAFFILFILCYLGGAYVMSRIKVPRETTGEKKSVTIYILSNGVHTDIVVPVRTPLIDWTDYVLTENTRKKDTLFSYLAFGWGDKGFYLNTPDWSQLKTSTAFNAAFGLSTTAIHATYYTEMKENPENCIKLKITPKQYRRLVIYILASLQHDKKGALRFIPTHAVYGDNDSFYEANGTYSLFQTCNSWANGALKSCGQEAALWTAFQGGIFCHYRD
ncbi:MAG: TIGR02117 family protein [Bacteroidota bacterium]